MHHADKPEAATAEDDMQHTDKPQAETAAKSKSVAKLAKTDKPAPEAAPSPTPKQPAAGPVSDAELPAGTGLDGDQAGPTDKGKHPQVRIWPLIVYFVKQFAYGGCARRTLFGMMW